MDSSKYKILLVDDEADILEFLKYNLEKEGYQVFTAKNGEDAIKMANQEIPHLIILDIMMPGINGIEACRIIREQERLKNTVIAFLTARGEDYSQISGFEAGADDYIVKPIKPKTLVSRVGALLRRITAVAEPRIIETSDLKINMENFMVTFNGKEFNMPKKEFELLIFLLSKPGKVFGREEILNNVWGSEVIVGDRTIDVHVRKLREKFGNDKIKTVKGFGYQFET